MHSMCIELEHGECERDDRDDDVQVERDGVLLEGVGMVVMVVTAEKDLVSAAEYDDQVYILSDYIHTM